ncbi:MAG TPA: hypothetical protein VGD36_13155 [Xanthobacteraceae bacterium]|jgi:hypothetical protein
MSHIKTLVLAAVTVCFAGAALAQMPSTSPPDRTQPATSMQDRQTAAKAKREEAAQRRAAEKAKRDACRAEAKEKKIGLLKRNGYVRECMKRA